MSQPEFRFTFKDFDAEMFFVKRLGDHGRHVHDGITDRDERRERIRYAIIDGKLDCAIIGKHPSGKAETYAQAFERYYTEPLIPPSSSHKRKATPDAVTRKTAVQDRQHQPASGNPRRGKSPGDRRVAGVDLPVEGRARRAPR
jgi:hypothetical protein